MNTLPEVAQRITKNRTAEMVDGFFLDLFTASTIAAVYDAANDKQRATMDGLNLRKLAQVCFKISNGGRS